jgi:hypothetical protein
MRLLSSGSRLGLNTWERVFATSVAHSLVESDMVNRLVYTFSSSPSSVHANRLNVDLADHQQLYRLKDQDVFSNPKCQQGQWRGASEHPQA